VGFKLILLRMGFTHIAKLLAFAPVAIAIGGPGEAGLPPTNKPTNKPTTTPTAEPTRPPTRPADPTIFPATFDEYALGDTCGSSKFTKGSCYKSPTGGYFRFGCKQDDGLKIYTDVCGQGGCDPVNCANDWKWHLETANQCMTSEEAHFKYTCHAPGAPQDVDTVGAEVATPTDAPVVEKKICSELGWPTSPGSDDVCGASAVLNGRCPVSNVDFETAHSSCAKIGARLCTVKELNNDEAKGTGCKADCKRVWAADSCTLSNGQAGRMTAAGALKCSGDLPNRCEDVNSENSAVFRCCADAAGVSVTVSSEDLPAGYVTATSHDYPRSDLKCGASAPIASYSCWVNPSDGRSQRFACKSGEATIYSQDCGTDPKCQTCFGDWFSTDEEEGKCYSADDSVFYSYKCGN